LHERDWKYLSYLKVFDLRVAGIANPVECLGILATQGFHIGTAFVADTLAAPPAVMPPLSHAEDSLADLARLELVMPDLVWVENLRQTIHLDYILYFDYYGFRAYFYPYKGGLRRSASL